MDADEVARAFGQTLRKFRKTAQLTQEQLALYAHLQRNYVSELELGQKQPSVTTLMKLARALGVMPSEFIGYLDSLLSAPAKPPSSIN